MLTWCTIVLTTMLITVTYLFHAHQVCTKEQQGNLFHNCAPVFTLNKFTTYLIVKLVSYNETPTYFFWYRCQTILTRTKV